ncbi:MAG: hypothetical protein O3C63_06090 [Cyanobacteria bacterium]|nr:hypothetical protein [Cyanobacteriota bacterium]MDA1020797.1 hypothetical protein [Cyanobacteriota bacterium]
MQDLIAKFDLETDSKYLLVFDVDGTLRPDEVIALDHRYPKIDPKAAEQLLELNQHDKVDILILTARSYVDIFRSNLPKNIKKYCGFGKQVVENDAVRYTRQEFANAYDETIFFIDIIKDILGPHLTQDVSFLVTPGDFAMYFESHEYEAQKKSIMNVLEIVFAHSNRWEILDFGKELIFKDAKYPYDKGDAIWDILDQIDLSELTQVFFFGDSMADYKAMLALRAYQQKYQQKRLKVKNVCVGPALVNEEAVTIKLDSYKDTIKFLESLHQKVCR